MCASSNLRYFISTSGFRRPSLIYHPPWRRPVLTIVPLCCLMQKICGFRWNFTYIPSAMSGLSISGFTSEILISGWTRIQLCTERFGYLQQWLYAYSKANAATLNFFQKLFTPFDSMVTKFIIFSPKNHPHHLHFRWCNSITGWTITKISTSFYHALMALGIRRSAMKYSDGKVKYLR